MQDLRFVNSSPIVYTPLHSTTVLHSLRSSAEDCPKRRIVTDTLHETVYDQTFNHSIRAQAQCKRHHQVDQGGRLVLVMGRHRISKEQDYKPNLWELVQL